MKAKSVGSGSTEPAAAQMVRPRMASREYHDPMGVGPFGHARLRPTQSSNTRSVGRFKTPSWLPIQQMANKKDLRNNRVRVGQGNLKLFASKNVNTIADSWLANL